MSAEDGKGFAVILPREKIIDKDGNLGIHHVDMISSDPEAGQRAINEVEKNPDILFSNLSDSRTRRGKSFGFSSAFDNGNCKWIPTGPKPNWEVESRIKPPKDPRVN